MSIPVQADTDIDVLTLNTLVYNALRRYDINTVGQLAAYSSKQLRELHPFGAGSVRLIIKALAECGFRLADTPPISHVADFTIAADGGKLTVRCPVCPADAEPAAQFDDGPVAVAVVLGAAGAHHDRVHT